MIQTIEQREQRRAAQEKAPFINSLQTAADIQAVIRCVGKWGSQMRDDAINKIPQMVQPDGQISCLCKLGELCELARSRKQRHP